MPTFDLPCPEGDPPDRLPAYVEVKVTLHNGTVQRYDFIFAAHDVTKISRATGYDLGLSTASLGGPNGQIEIRIAPGHFRVPLTIGTRQVAQMPGNPPVYTDLGPDTLTDQAWSAWPAQTGNIWQDQFRVWRLTS